MVLDPGKEFMNRTALLEIRLSINNAVGVTVLSVKFGVITISKHREEFS